MKKIVFLTGAGVSAESGVSTFRDSGGLWEQYDVQDVASIKGYRRNPELVIEFYNQRRAQMKDVEPNDAHRLIADLQKDFEVVVVTQNVDNLHERAGSENVIHLHGELTKATSSNDPNDPSCIVTLPDYTSRIEMGDKAADGSQLRPFIVWFGEAVPMIQDAAIAVNSADILVVVGTSLNVYPAAGLLSYANSNADIYLIDPSPVNVPTNIVVNVIAEKATEGMAHLCEMLRAE